MRGLELVRDGESKEPAKEETQAVIRGCHERGLIILPCGTYGNVIRVLVPLVASDDQIEEGLAVLEASLSAVTASVTTPTQP